MPYKVKLETHNDIVAFNNRAQLFGSEITLTDGNKYRVNAKSLLGCLASIQWPKKFIETTGNANSLYNFFEDFID